MTPSTPKKKAVITSVKNTSQYLIRLTNKDSLGNIRGPSVGVGMDPGTATGAFNGFEAKQESGKPWRPNPEVWRAATKR